MTLRNLFAMLLISIAVSISAVAQHEHALPAGRQEAQPKNSQRQHSMADMMGEPTFQKTVDGAHLQVWIITQNEHRKMMEEHMDDQRGKSELKEKSGAKGMGCDMMHGKNMMGMMHGKKADHSAHHMMEEDDKHKGNEMTKETMEAMMAGTHHVMMKLTDSATAKEIKDAEVKISVTSPSNKTVTVKLASMMNHFGGGLALDEKGRYTLDVWVTTEERTRTTSFMYEIE